MDSLSLDALIDAADGEGLIESPSRSCVTPGNPYVLHCFPAFKTKLTSEHHTHLDIIAKKIKRSFRAARRPITRIAITGHSSTWHGTSRSSLIGARRTACG